MSTDEILDRVKERWCVLQRTKYKTPEYHRLVRQIRQLANTYRIAEKRERRHMTDHDEDEQKQGEQHDKDNGLHGKVHAAMKKTDQELDADCTLCNNAQWWIDNGFSEAERRAFCASIGCPIPPASE